MASLGKNKSFDLQELSLSNGKKAIDIRDMFVQCTIFEDITLPCISGQIAVKDSIGLVELFPLVGNETVTLKYTSSKTYNHEVFEKTFFVSGIDEWIIDTNKRVGFIIRLHTLPFFMNSQRSIRRSYADTTSGVVENICKNILKIPADELFVESTYETRRFVVPNMRPFEVIYRMADTSLKPTSDDKVADFVFFENRDGFHFASLQTLSQARSSQILKWNETPSNIHKTDLDKVRSLKFGKMWNQNDNLENGMYRSSTYVYDSISKDYRMKDTQYESNFNEGLHLDSGGRPMGGSFSVDPDATINFITSSAEHPFETREKSLGPRAMQMQAFSNYSAIAECEGNTNQTIGKVVDLDLISIRNSNQFKTDEDLSGRYLIWRKKHVISPTSCSNVIELRKDCLKA